MSKLHARDGWYFEPKDDGSVVLTGYRVHEVFDRETWAKVVEHCSGLSVRELVHRAHATARSKGWHDNALRADELAQTHSEATAILRDVLQGAEADRFGALVALIHSEASEALEAYRDRGLDAWAREKDGKPEGVAAELADIVIRIGDVCGLYGIDLDAAIRQKMAFNETRPHRHGGKAL